MTELAIPDAVVRMNLAANGAAGRAWLEALPRIVAELRARWGLATLGSPFVGGFVGFVAPAERSDGEHVVLKVSFVDEETRHEPDALALWDGDGAVRLLESDPNLGALLLERLEPGTPLERHPDRDAAIAIACGLLRRLWRAVPPDHPFTPVGALALRWGRELPERFGRFDEPFEESILARAVELCEAFAGSDEQPVLANRDYHLGNVLAARREPWLLIDPKPLAGERAFDTGHFLRSLFPEELDGALVDRLVSRLASELDLSAERIRAWSFVRSVEDVLWALSVGDPGVQWYLRCARVLGAGL